MEQEGIEQAAHRLIAAASAPGLRAAFRGLRRWDHPEAWAALYRYAGDLEEDTLRGMGLLLGAFRHRPGFHPALGLRDHQRRFFRLVRSPDPLALAEGLVRSRGILGEEIDLVATFRSLAYWNDRERLSWIKVFAQTKEETDETA